MKTLLGKINLWENLNSLPYDRKEDLIANIKFSTKNIRKQLFFPLKLLKRDTMAAQLYISTSFCRVVNISLWPFAVGDVNLSLLQFWQQKIQLL